MKQYEASAKSYEEAVELGLKELGVSFADVDIKVLEEGSKGLFGLFGSRLTKVLLTVKEDADPLEDLIMEEKPAVKEPAPVKEAVKPAEAPKPAPAPKAEEKAEPARPAPVRREAKKTAERKPRPEADETEEKAAPAELIRMEKPEVKEIPEGEIEEGSPVAAAYAFLKEVTHLMGVDVTISMGIDEEGNIYGNMNGDTLGILIGRRGETLDALQYLTSVKVNRNHDTYTRVTLDTENYRAKREDTLIRLANRMANRAVRTGRRVSLEPMNPYERRVIHYALQKNELVDTHSEGDEPARHVVITLKK